MRSKISSKLIFASAVVCDTPIARITGFVSSLRTQVGDFPWNYSVACTRVNRVMLINLSRGNYKTRIMRGDKIRQLAGVEGKCNTLIYFQLLEHEVHTVPGTYYY